jgi:HlyD family secretion protein
MPAFVISITNESLKREVEAKRKEAEVVLVAWQTLVNKHPDALTDDIPEIKTYLHTLQLFFDALSSAINTLEAQNGLSATTIDTYKTDVYSARTNVNSAMTNILAGEQILSAAKATLLVEKKTLALKNSPAGTEEVKIQEALVDKARALVQKYKSELGKKTIISPLNGVITKKSAKVGEIVGAQSVVLSIISTANYEIETYIPEADIRKVNVGDKARITLDAYDDDVIFEATVSSIEPAETEIDGVSTYKAVMQFVKADERIRSGMTANIDITTDKKEAVLAVPSRAIHRIDDKEYIKIQIGKETIDILVTTGIKNDSGLVEISGEVAEGDVVILEQ